MNFNEQVAKSFFIGAESRDSRWNPGSSTCAKVASARIAGRRPA